MHIAVGLRRKRDEIAATIAAYEARIDAARRDLAALDQAARLFELEAEGDESVIPLDRDSLVRPQELLEALHEAHEKQQALAIRRSPPPFRGRGTYSVSSRRRLRTPRTGQDWNGYRSNFFIWIGRNPLKSPDSKK
jgi:hypothetical protein